MDKRLIFIFLLISILHFLSPAIADTVYLNNGEEEKGIVVENYYDRIVFSTVNGEMEIDRENIKDILYDRREQNLLKLGDFHWQKGNLMKAYTYFKKASQINPDYKEAQDKFIHIRSILLRRPEKQLRDDMAKKQALFIESGKVYEPRMPKTVSAAPDKRFKKATGLVLISENEMPKVEMVVAGSPATRAGIEKGDLIFAVWGRLTGYMDMATLIDTIIESSSAEVMLTIKRKLAIPAVDKDYSGVADLGFLLDMKEEGLVVYSVEEGSPAAKRGLASGDIVTAIYGKPTRYMPLKDALQLFNESSSQGKVEFEIIKDVILWARS